MAIDARALDGCAVTDDPDLQALGASIRRLRKARGWSIEELSDACGLSANYISDLERGQRNVGVKALFAVARSLGSSPAVFFAERQDDHCSGNNKAS